MVEIDKNTRMYYDNLTEKDHLLLNIGLSIFCFFIGLVFIVFILPSWYDYDTNVVGNNNWLILPLFIIASVITLVCGVSAYINFNDYLTIKREIKIYESEHQEEE